MKHIVIIGTKDSGKSETIGAICKELNPSEIYSIDLKKPSLVEKSLSTKIENDTYVIEVDGKYILVAAGAPTEQRKRITDIFKDVTVVLNIPISFMIVARRSSERSSGFNTIDELNSISECVHTERIRFIEGTTKDTIKDSAEFKKRIAKLVSIIKREL